MSNPFFDHPILNSPYECPTKHWELDPDGQPTQQVKPTRRRAEFITPIPKPKKRKVAMHAAGVTLMRGRPSLVADAIDISRLTYAKIRQNLFWAFVYNLVGDRDRGRPFQARPLPHHPACGSAPGGSRS